MELREPVFRKLCCNFFTFRITFGALANSGTSSQSSPSLPKKITMMHKCQIYILVNLEGNKEYMEISSANVAPLKRSRACHGVTAMFVLSKLTSLVAVCGVCKGRLSADGQLDTSALSCQTSLQLLLGADLFNHCNEHALASCPSRCFSLGGDEKGGRRDVKIKNGRKENWNFF